MPHPPSGADPVTVDIVRPYDDWVPNGAGMLEVAGYCFPDTAVARAELRFWDPTADNDIGTIDGDWVGPGSFHWKFEFDPSDPDFPSGVWVTIVVYCRHPDYVDIGQDSVTVYCDASRLIASGKAALRIKPIKNNKQKAKKKRAKVSHPE